MSRGARRLSWWHAGFALLCLSLALAVRADAQRPLIVAHRGRLAPSALENCLAQFRATVAGGPFMLEMDLRRSRDGQVFLLHDPTLDRTTNQHGRIDSESTAQLARARLRYPDGHLSREPVPSFASVLDWAGSRPDVYLMLDLKDVDPGAIVAMVRAAHLSDRVILLTFDPDLATRTFPVADREMVSVLVKTRAEMTRYANLRGGKPLAFYLPQDASPALFQAAIRQGDAVITDTVMHGEFRPQATASYLAQHPTTILVTDHPRETARALSR